MRTPWLIAEPEPYDEYDLGPLKTGKEAEVFLVERVAADGRSCLLAHKRYRPRTVAYKGELQALGFQRAANFVNDRAYRDGRIDREQPRPARRGQTHAARQDGPPAGLARQRIRDAGAPRGRRRHGAVPGRTHGRRRPHAVHRRPRDGGTAAGPRRTSSRARRTRRGVARRELAAHGRSGCRPRRPVGLQPAVVGGRALDHRRPPSGRHHHELAGVRLPAPGPDERRAGGSGREASPSIPNNSSASSSPPRSDRAEGRRERRWRVRSYPVWTYGRAAGTCAGSVGRAGRRLVARHRSRLRPADGARAAPVPDRAAARRAASGSTRTTGRPSTTRRCSSTSAATPTRTSRRSGSATTSR